MEDRMIPGHHCLCFHTVWRGIFKDGHTMHQVMRRRLLMLRGRPQRLFQILRGRPLPARMSTCQLASLRWAIPDIAHRSPGMSQVLNSLFVMSDIGGLFCTNNSTMFWTRTAHLFLV